MTQCVIGDPVGNGYRRHDVQVVRWNHKRDWRLGMGYWLLAIGDWVWAIGYWRWVIGYWRLDMGKGLFQIFVYGIDANACGEEAEGSYVAMVGIG